MLYRSSRYSSIGSGCCFAPAGKLCVGSDKARYRPHGGLLHGRERGLSKVDVHSQN